MALQFNKDGSFFAHLADDGKLKIWNTASNSFEQEFVPDLHLTSPCTCLQFLEYWSKNASPKKKKKRNSFSDTGTDIILGTSSGKLIIYSISKGDVSSIVDGNINLPVCCLSPNVEEQLYSGIEENIVVWNLQQRIVVKKWKSGTDKISAILAVPYTRRLLTASKSIKLWDIENKSLLKTYSGHSSEVHLLQVISNTDSSEPKYAISGSKGDRLLNCWNLDDKMKGGHSTASLLMEDSVKSIALNTSPDGTTKLAATIESGAVHIFQLVLNGKCSKPVKPKTTIRVVADTGQKGEAIFPIPILSSFFKNENSLLISHGSSIILTFEDVELLNQKNICLERDNPFKQKSKDNKSNKILTPIVGNDVHYVTPFNNVDSAAKRKADGKLEVPMEKRLENLSIDKLEEGQIPKSSNMAQLLLQGLRSKDQNIIRTVLSKRDEQVIKNTVKRLPLKVIAELVKELTKFVQGKTVSSNTGAVWLRHLIQVHAGLLISNPDLPDLFGPMLNSIENRLALQTPLNRLRGRLDLLVSQADANAVENKDESEEAMLVFNDRDSSGSDEEIDMAELNNSLSENEWSEESSEEEMIENDKSAGSDEDEEEMST